MGIRVSESVTVGHPDKLCDQISDTILDHYVTLNPRARVAIETTATSRGVIIAGEINGVEDDPDAREALVRRTISSAGYGPDSGYDPETIPVWDHVTRQSSQISQAVDNQGETGAGDQGLMFGYATNETPEFMPLPLMLARDITTRLRELREQGRVAFLRPDGKAQVCVENGPGGPRVTNVVVSTQHTPGVSLDDLREWIRQAVVGQVLSGRGLDSEGVKLIIQPAGAWTIGGPAADTGLTGRKIIVDTYGGEAPHGGGAFSGKDPSKVDRSAAYAARWAAKQLVAEGNTGRALVTVAYAIGQADPVMVTARTGETLLHDDAATSQVTSLLDFRPDAIIERFRLTEPWYYQAAKLGHFGNGSFPWEDTEFVVS